MYDKDGNTYCGICKRPFSHGSSWAKKPIRQFSSGATRDTADGKPEFGGFLSPIVIRRFGEYMHKHRLQSDGALRASDNWKAGFPRRQTLESLLRHTIDVWEYVTGDSKEGEQPADVEDALCAVIFNSQSLLREILLKRDVAK